NMPGMGGLEAIRFIRRSNAAVAIGVLTMFETADYVRSALEAGANGYVAKDATPKDFASAAAALAEGARDLVSIPGASPVNGQRTQSAMTGRIANLTARERGVLRALAGGGSN